jgi:cytochrome c553
VTATSMAGGGDLMIRVTLLAAAALLAAPALAADPEAGREKAQQCAGCHGEAGVSVSGEIPNLAAQKAEYLEEQLKAFREGERTNPLMNGLAAQLEDAEIENLAAHFAALPGAAPGATGTMSAELAGTRPRFPENHADDFTRYTTISLPERAQVRHYWANNAALEAARAGEPFPPGAYLFVEIYKAELDDAGMPMEGADGHFVEAGLTAFTAMEKSPGWGDAVPEILRNDDWRYAVFTPAGEHKAGTNEAPCLACHRPLEETDYVFTYGALKAAAGAPGR